MEQTLQRITQEVRSNLKLSADMENTAKRYVKRAVNQTLIYCNRQDIPPLLEDTVAQIAEDMLRADGIIQTEQEVSSITRGDTSISYRDKSSSQRETVSFMKNYEKQLIHFKRMKLPEDRP